MPEEEKGRELKKKKWTITRTEEKRWEKRKTQWKGTDS